MYWRLLSGYHDWGKWRGRYKQVLRSIAKEDVARRNYPFNLELISWIREQYDFCNDHGKEVAESAIMVRYEMYSALTIGFFYLLRVCEIENLRTMGVRIPHEEGKYFLTIYIKGGSRPIQSMRF